MDRIEENEPHPVNILIVDDNESNLLALETILEGSDRNLVRAASGDEALQYLLHHEVAVILLDVRMPGISGLETAELIRGRKHLRDVPIIFLTAYAGDSVETSRGYSLGAVDYLIKPLDPQALRSKVSVFVELFKKNEQVKKQALLLHEKNIQLQNANSERLGKLVHLARQMAGERNADGLLRLFCDSAREILGAGYAAVRISYPGEDVPVHFIESGIELTISASRSADPAHMPASDAATWWPAGLRTAWNDRVGDSMESLGHHILTEIPMADGSNGRLFLARKASGEVFNEADERIAMTLTLQVAAAYENVRLYAEAQQQADELVAEVAERKQAQEEKEKLLLSEKAARLEAETSQRLSRELLVREKHARTEAEAANRLKDDFLATVSHELRTPLNAMLGWTVLLRERRLDEEAAESAIEIIERNARTLSRIVGDILDASRIINGKLALDLSPVELMPVIKAAVDVLRPAAVAKKVSLDIGEPNGGSLIVLGDADRLRQIVWNLVSNAIKFTPQGGLVNIGLESTGSFVKLVVKDSGLGISQEFLPYVFERFRQADSSMKRSQSGLGLGLAIVRHLVELHGGSVHAHSLGKGTGATFTVQMPLATSVVANSVAPGCEPISSDYTNPESHLLDVGSTDLGGLRILVVDDEADSRTLMKTILERFGARVRESTSAADGLEALADWKPHLLLSDIGMADEDGYDLIRKVRAMSTDLGGSIPAAAITAFASAEDRQRALAAGYSAHLSKPIDRNQLLKLVQDLTCHQPHNEP